MQMGNLWSALNVQEREGRRAKLCQGKSSRIRLLLSSDLCENHSVDCIVEEAKVLNN